MRGFSPSRPTGSNPEAIFAQSQWDRSYTQQERLNNSSTVKFSRTSRGIFGKATKQDSGGNGGLIGPYLITAVNGDYVTLRTWDGTTLGSVDVYAAKPWKLRCSRRREVIDGVLSTFSYSTDPPVGNVTRTKTKGAQTESEIVYPQWAIGTNSDADLVYAMQARNTLVTTVAPDPIVAVKLVLIDSARNWAFYNP